MKKAAGVAVPLVLILAVSVYLAVKKEPSKDRVIKTSIALPEDLQKMFRAAAAKDAPPYVKNKRFLPAIANAAGTLLSSGKKFDPGELSDTIQRLGSPENMGPDIMSDSVQKEAEVTGEVEEEVAKDTIDKLLGDIEKKEEDGEEGGDGDGGTGEIKAEIDFEEEKGMVEDGMFAPPGMKMKVDIEEDPEGDDEDDDMSEETAYSYPMGMGTALMNGCFGTGYVPGDPCYDDTSELPACYNMMEGCGYVGVGFDGRGDYSSTSRRKTVVQRNCGNSATYQGEDVPDNMNVHGIYDTEITSNVFNSKDSYRHSLQQEAGVSFSGFGFQAAVDSAWGGSSSSETEKFMSLIKCDIIRYEIFLDEVTPDSLSLPFLRDFLSLPKNFIQGKAKLQDFILRYGTHFIKSAKFGGSFKLFKTQEASKSESLEEFSVQAQASYNSMFFNAGAHYSNDESTENKSSSQTSSTHLMIEGGDQEVAAIVADFYTTGFKETLAEWLKSVPTYPKPIEMFMGTMSELLNLNFKLLFPFDISDAADGCFSKNLLTEEGTGRKYYNVPVLVKDKKSNGTTTRHEKRYCEDSSVDQFQESMDKKRLALERAIAVYMEEGPIPTTDFHLSGGRPGCQTEDLIVEAGDAGVSHPSWLDLINGDTYKIVFDLEEDISKNIKRDTEAYAKFSESSWNCHKPGAPLHIYNSYDNGGSGNAANKRVSCFGFVMTYVEDTGKFLVTEDDMKASAKVLGNIPRDLLNSKVARAEYISPLEHSQGNSRALASILEAPCTVKWSNSYQIKPAEEGGRCLYFVAASAGDIFVVFSAIPRDKTTWYHLQISFQGVALFKAMKLVKYEGAKSARSLGDSKLFQPYFVCIEEDMDKKRTYIKYGIGSDNSEKGLVYMVYSDNSEPLGIRFYSFGSGEKPVEIMDARVIEGGATGQMECTGGTVMKDGMCVEDCHPECKGCIPKSPGSKLDTECRLCQHYSNRKDDGSTQCVATCPAGKKAAPNGMTCICADYTILTDDGATQCISACPDTHVVGDDGVTCESKELIPKWRDDGRCGSGYTTQSADPAQCDPRSSKPCCSSSGWCGAGAHCTCSGCVDYRPKWRDDLKCGQNFPALGANPGQCDRKSDTPCCDKDGWCGSTASHCTCSDCIDYRNVALKKTAGQTSTGFGGVASRAVDGNSGTDFRGLTCMHTAEQGNPTWWVDLGQPYAVERVVIYNRWDCCSERINPFVIHIGDSSRVTSNPQCGGEHRMIQKTISISCQNMQGRYVAVRLPGSSRTLSLCEVQVFPCYDCIVFKNVAVGKAASQTSTGGGGAVASRAVDDNTDTNFAGGSCTHTLTEPNPTWRVDLGQSYVVDRVVIFNRYDCCGDRLNPFNIHIGDSPEATANPKCGGDHRIHQNAQFITVQCQRMEGRYVFLRLPGSSRVMSLCEVQVFAGRAP
ncbi:uncharacterized protein LOC144869684 [Branchiostoma floridae x Branchiostoma japonicum]